MAAPTRSPAADPNFPSQTLAPSTVPPDQPSTTIYPITTQDLLTTLTTASPVIVMEPAISSPPAPPAPPALPGGPPPPPTRPPVNHSQNRNHHDSGSGTEKDGKDENQDESSKVGADDDDRSSAMSRLRRGRRLHARARAKWRARASSAAHDRSLSRARTARDSSSSHPTSAGGDMRVFGDCAAVLAPLTKDLKHMRVTAVAFIFYEIWMLLLALSGILLQSVPHLLAIGVGHLLAAGFSLYQTVFILALQHDPALGASSSACEGDGNGGPGLGLPLLSQEMISVQETVVVLEFLGFIVLAAVGWQLKSVLSFGQFAAIGADPVARHRRHLTLALGIALQLSLFFLVAFQSIWLREIVVDKLATDPHAAEGGAGAPYEVVLAVLTAYVPVWAVVTGIAARRERVWLMAASLTGSAGFVVHGIWLETRPVYVNSTVGWGFLRFLGAVGIVGAGATIVLGAGLLCSWLRGDKSDGADVEWVMPFVASSRSRPDSRASTLATALSSSQAKLSAAFEYYSRPSTSSTLPSAPSTQPTTAESAGSVLSTTTESSLSLHDPSSAERSLGRRPRKAPPPALVLAAAVGLRKAKTNVVPFGADIDGHSIRPRTSLDLPDQEEEELEQGEVASHDGHAHQVGQRARTLVGGSSSNSQVLAREQSAIAEPAQWPVTHSIERRKPLSAVPEIQAIEEQPVISTWFVKQLKQPRPRPGLTIDTSARPPSHRRQDARSERVGGPASERARKEPLKSRWSDSTRTGSERLG